MKKTLYTEWLQLSLGTIGRMGSWGVHERDSFRAFERWHSVTLRKASAGESERKTSPGELGMEQQAGQLVHIRERNPIVALSPDPSKSRIRDISEEPTPREAPWAEKQGKMA
jgi:hypothetical protein